MAQEIVNWIWKIVSLPWTTVRWYMGKRNCNVLFLGLDNAGKTTLLHIMRDDKLVAHAPTMFPSNEPFTVGQVTYTGHDMGGHEAGRKLWKQYCADIDGIVFLVDSSDPSRMQEAGQELYNLLVDESLCVNQVPILVIGNKTDKATAIKSEREFTQAMQSEELAKHMEKPGNWNVFMCSSVHRYNIKPAFEWLNSRIIALAAERERQA